MLLCHWLRSRVLPNEEIEVLKKTFYQQFNIEPAEQKFIAI
jgi:hypothetical protein